MAAPAQWFEDSVTVAQEHAGLRVDRFAAVAFPEFTRSFLQKAIRRGQVLLNGARTKPKTAVREGDRISVRLPMLPADHLEPEPIPLDIVSEDEHMLVLNKPADLVVHPSRGNASGTLANGLLYHCRNHLSDLNGPLRPGIVHRLDRNTTGVILVAKTNLAHSRLSEQFQLRTVSKRYLAVVRGSVPHDEGEVALSIARDRRVREKMRAQQTGGRRAISHYAVLERFARATYLRVEPRTGRTHQIRVHMSSLGHPVLADALYGGGGACYASELRGEPRRADEKPVIERQALHAWSIGFEHPATRDPMSFEVDPPQDFQAVLRVLRGESG